MSSLSSPYSGVYWSLVRFESVIVTSCQVPLAESMFPLLLNLSPSPPLAPDSVSWIKYPVLAGALILKVSAVAPVKFLYPRPPS
ncbi:MAG: hypothetical protein BWY84_00208 [Candidatus Aerophobetes bacterium ADurb.Bin490]|nr:MAG: hypothetical protein BWY84_00208 [Candidatus Aerophobetes bacterium ADurb.Bin490]